MIRHLWQTQRIAMIAFAIAFSALVYFGVKTAASAIYWMDPAHQNQAIAGWMSPRYVERSYRLPPEVARPALFLDVNTPPRRISLDAIASQNGVSLSDLQSRIDDAAAAWRASEQARRDTRNP